MEALAAGQRIGAYAVEGQVGQGGMGAVYRARDTSLGRIVALKVIRATAGEEPAADMVARFLREARLGASLSHPNIVVVYEAGAFGDVPYLAMEWVDGRPLEALIDDTSFGLPQRIEILDSIADALAYAHAHGVIHRDVKPNNVMVDARGRARLVDFGIAKRTAHFAPGTMMLPTHAKQVLGTPAYMAPEQMLSASVDARADQFSWGVMAYELLTTNHPNTTVPEEGPPFPVAKPSPIVWLRPEVPEALAAVVHRAISYEPGTRFGTMDELLAAWRAAKSGVAGVSGSSGGAAYGAPTGNQHSPSHAVTPYQPYGGPSPYGIPGSAPGNATTVGGQTSGTMMPPTAPMGASQHAMQPMMRASGHPGAHPSGHAGVHAYAGGMYGMAPAPSRSFPWLALVGAVLALVLIGGVGAVFALARTTGGGSPISLPAAGGGAAGGTTPLGGGGPKRAVLEDADEIHLKFTPPAPNVTAMKSAIEAKVTPCFAPSSVSKDLAFKAEIFVAADGRITKVGEQNVCRENSPSHYLCTEREKKTPKKGFPTVPDDVFACIERALLASRLPRAVVASGETTVTADFFFQVE